MKIALLLILTSFLFFANSCSSGKSNQLMKTWKLADTKVEILFQFSEDNAFLLQTQNFDGTVSQKKGTWKFSNDQSIVLIELNQEEQAFKISELTDKKLILLPEGEKIKMEFSVK